MYQSSPPNREDNVDVQGGRAAGTVMGDRYRLVHKILHSAGSVTIQSIMPWVFNDTSRPDI
jgi:hypothetical protein